MPAKTVEVRTEPSPDGYRQLTIQHVGELVPCPLDGVQDLDIDALLAGVVAS